MVQQVKERGEEKPKQHEGNYSSSPTSRLMPSQSLKNSHLGSQHPSFPQHYFFFLYLQFLLLRMMLHCRKYPFGQFGSSVQLCPLLTSHPSPAYKLRRSEQERESLNTVQAPSSNSQNLSVLSTLFSHKSKTQHCMSCCEEMNSIPARPSTQACCTPITCSTQSKTPCSEILKMWVVSHLSWL